MLSTGPRWQVSETPKKQVAMFIDVYGIYILFSIIWYFIVLLQQTVQLHGRFASCFSVRFKLQVLSGLQHTLEAEPQANGSCHMSLKVFPHVPTFK